MQTIQEGTGTSSEKYFQANREPDRIYEMEELN